MRKFINKIVDFIEEQKRYRRTVTELYKLSSTELEDIGISPSEIHYIAKEAAKGATGAAKTFS